MVARRLRSLSLAGAALAACISASCERVPLVAPTGSSITLNAGTTVLSANGTTTIRATVLEASGTPPHSGTHVTFTTTLGKITPEDIETDAAGIATVTFAANGSNGTAIVSATSGAAATGSNGALRLSLGSAAVSRIILNANPSTLPANGGTSSITAIVFDVNGNPLAATPVVFSTNAGTLSSALVATDNNGLATTAVTTSQAATITASVGAQGSSTGSTGNTGGTGNGGTGTTPPSTSSGTQSASVQIPITPAPTIAITPPSTSPSKGLPSVFTFVVTPATQGGFPIKSVSVNWGDGSSESLGSITGSQAVSHVFTNDGPFKIEATVTDAGGGTNTASTTIVVVPVASPTIIITPSAPGSCTGSGSCTVSFAIQVTPPAGVGIVSASINFATDDPPGAGKVTPPTSALGGLSGTATVSATYVAHAGQERITVTVLDTLGRTTEGATTVVIP